MLSSFVHLLGFSGLVLASPTLITKRQSAVTILSSTQVASFKPYSFYAASAYCDPSTTLSWSCGANCQANPTFIPVASGGDGGAVQFWYVGFDPTLQTVIVGHQGTDVSKIEAVLTDANFNLTALNSNLFPTAPSNVQVHAGFKAEHSLIAATVLSAVNTALQSHSANQVTVVGHSLGAALALLDAIYLRGQLPSTTGVRMVSYGSPRVGNPAFANYVDTLGVTLTHVANKKDLVTVIPPIFLGYQHTSGEVHIKEDNTWASCPGHDNTNSQCTLGDVPIILLGDPADHSGPYDGVIMDC